MNATIHFTCPQCSHTMQLPETLVGTQGKCPSCGQVITVQMSLNNSPLATPLLPSGSTAQPGTSPLDAPITIQPSETVTPVLVKQSSKKNLKLLLGLAVLLVFGGVTAAFIVQKTGSPAGVSYIPPDCVGGVRLRVQDLLDLQIMKWLPVEVAEAFGKERMGVDIHDIVEVIGLMSAPEVRSVEQYSGRSYVRYEDPDGGGIVRFSTSYELEDLFQWSEFQTREVTMEDGGEALLIRDGGLDVLFTMPDSRTLLIGTEGMVRKMIENKNGRNASSFTNQFATLKDESQLALVINVEAFTPEMIEEAREEIARERLPSWVDDLVGRLFRLESGDLQIQIDSGLLVTVTARAKDHTAAVKLHESLTQALERGREMILDELDFYTGDDVLDHSLGRYASRVSKQVIDLLQFEVGGQSVVLQTELIK